MIDIKPSSEIISKIKSFQEANNIENRLTNIGIEERNHLVEEWKNNGSKGKKPNFISPYHCACILMKFINFILFDDEENTKLAMYQENKGIYTQNISVIKRTISYLEPYLNSSKADDVIYHIRNKAKIKKLTNSPNLIPVNNGIFNRKSKKLEPFTSEYVFTSKICTNYVENAELYSIENWNFDSWLDEIACHDMEVYTLLWQVINDCLNGNYTRKKAIFLVGDGNNGKGTFQTLLSNLIGFDNVASLKVNEFDHEFKLSILEGKTLVIGDDVPVGINIEDSSNFNSVVTGDAVLVNPKKKQPYRAIYRCTVIQSTNGMPYFKNKTGGTNRRLLIVPFNADFNGDIERTEIKDTYLKNNKVLEYVLHKAINLDFKNFLIPKVSKDMLEEFKQDNDPVLDFKIVEFENWKTDKVPVSIVYQKYKLYCDKSGYKPLSERKFFKAFERYLSKNWKKKSVRYYSVKELQNKIGYFEPTLLPHGELKQSYINENLKAI